MTVSTIASIASGLVRPASGRGGVSSASFGNSSANPRDIVSYPSELQKEGASLRVAVQTVARVTSQIDAASTAASEISSIVSQLQTLAVRASAAGLTDSQREALNAEFQSLRQKINNVATESKVDGVSLISGNRSGSENTIVSTAAIGGLTDKNLFGENDVNLLSAVSASGAVETVAAAQNYVTTQIGAISAARSTADIAATTLESAVQNQEAASATFSENDFLAASIQGSVASQLQNQPAQALAAQTNRLPADILRLLAE